MVPQNETLLLRRRTSHGSPSYEYSHMACPEPSNDTVPEPASVVDLCPRSEHLRVGHVILVPIRSLTRTRLSALAFANLLDRIFYGEWVSSTANFIKFNFSQDIAVFYGRNRPDYYLTEGLPLLLTTALPFAIAGIVAAFLQSQSVSSQDKQSVSLSLIHISEPTRPY